ncbi:MAG: helix-turn-helix transcriptional regulator [Clostridia bacterium]|nr:helix-turn-helix transcriptional regulator [Clostridia bacterium]
MHLYANYPESETFFTSMYNVDFSYPSHLHGCFEVSFCMKGEVTVIIDGQSHTVGLGQGILIPPNTIHSYKTPQSSAYYTILFSRDLLQDFAALFSKNQPTHYVFSFDSELSQHLINFHTSKQSLFGVKAVLYRMAEAFLQGNTFAQKDKADNDLTTRIISYIQEHLHEQITLQDLSDHLGYNYYYISKRLQQIFNTPFVTLLSQYRVADAKLLLNSGKYTVSQVAMASGFGSIRTFNRVFLKITGQTPTEYLSMHWVQKL